jgi:ABC-type sugar transport system substrate-binding protein
LHRFGWWFAVLFGLALAGATAMNFILLSQARQALDEGILGNRSAAVPAHHHLALIIPDTTDSFFDGLVGGMTEKAHDADVAVQVFRYRRGEDEAETYFQLCLTSHLDGVVLFAGPERLAERAIEARRENVILIPVGTQVPRDRQGFIGSSTLLQGFESGNQVGLLKGRSARIGLLLSSDGQGPPTEDPMYRGVAASIQAFPGATIVKSARARPGILSGEEAVSALLRSDPSINILVCGSAPVTEGAAQVVVDQGRVGQVLIVGTDGSPTIDRLVDKGVIAASVVRDSNKMGAIALQAFVQARNGTPFNSSIEVGFQVRSRKDKHS